MAKNTNTENVVPESINEIEQLKKQLEEAQALMAEQAKIIDQQSAVIKQNAETFDKLKEATASDTIVGQNVIEYNERMKEKTTVFYPQNPFDPDKTHVKVSNPITGQIDSVAVGEWVEVTRAVAKILERSAKADKITLVLQKSKSAEYEAVNS